MKIRSFSIIIFIAPFQSAEHDNNVSRDIPSAKNIARKCHLGVQELKGINVNKSIINRGMTQRLNKGI